MVGMLINPYAQITLWQRDNTEKTDLPGEFLARCNRAEWPVAGECLLEERSTGELYNAGIQLCINNHPEENGYHCAYRNFSGSAKVLVYCASKKQIAIIPIDPSHTKCLPSSEF